MKIKVLGSSGSDLPGHNLTSFLLDNTILFDAGGVTNSLNLKEQQKVKYIFITHAHLDHIRDIPFLADNIIISGNKKVQIKVFSIDEVIEDIKKHLLNQKLWPDFTVIPNEKDSLIKLEKINLQQSFEVEGFKITALPVNHTVPAVGYFIQKGKKFLFFTGDTGPTKKTWELLSNVVLDVLIIECSFPDKMKRIAKMTGHLTPYLLFKDIENLRFPPKKIYITHLKPLYRKAIERDLKKNKNYQLEILRDGDILVI